MEYADDSKSSGFYTRVGSTPTMPTKTKLFGFLRVRSRAALRVAHEMASKKQKTFILAYLYTTIKLFLNETVNLLKKVS